MEEYEQFRHSCVCCRSITLCSPFETFESTFSLEAVEEAVAQQCDLFELNLGYLLMELSNLQSSFFLHLTCSSEDSEKDVNAIEFQWFEGGAVLTEKLTLFVFSPPDDLPAQSSISAPLNLEPASVEATHLLRSELAKCISKHTECRRLRRLLTNDIRPRRLIAVSELQQAFVRIVESRDFTNLDRPYTALSYRWPKNDDKKGLCEKSTLEDFHKSILVQALPPSIQDAIKVTRDLGYRYLWVDRLCIVQDDECEKKVEIRKMKNIYQNAHLVISAARKGSESLGFLYPRTLEETYRHIWQISISSGEKVLPVYLSASQLVNDEIESIDERAWTMQEHFLAFRLVRFGSRQTEWICPSSHIADGGNDEFLDNEHPIFFNMRPKTHVHFTQRADTESFGDSSQDYYIQSWLALLVQYSRREISFQQDRLPALSAVAEALASATGWRYTDYYAGLWKYKMELQLLWHATSEERQTKDGHVKESDSANFGPSWSWSSFSGCFDFLGTDDTRAGWPMDAKIRALPLLELDDAEHPFGKAKSGLLAVEGYVHHCHWSGETIEPGVRGDAISSYSIRWDSDDWRKPRDIVLLKIAASDDTRASGAFVGLVLTSDHGRNHRRLGFFELAPGALSDRMQDQMPNNIHGRVALSMAVFDARKVVKIE